MGFLTLAMLSVIVLYFICIGITPKSPPEPASAKPVSSWECDTCDTVNPSNWQACHHCGMDRPA
jgi:hypothetical protein